MDKLNRIKILIYHNNKCQYKKIKMMMFLE